LDFEFQNAGAGVVGNHRGTKAERERAKLPKQEAEKIEHFRGLLADAVKTLQSIGRLEVKHQHERRGDDDKIADDADLVSPSGFEGEPDFLGHEFKHMGLHNEFPPLIVW